MAFPGTLLLKPRIVSHTRHKASEKRLGIQHRISRRFVNFPAATVCTLPSRRIEIRV